VHPNQRTPGHVSMEEVTKKYIILKGHYDEVKMNPVVVSVLGMLSMLPITYSKYSDRKNPHLMSSSDNRISGNAFYVVYK